MSKVILSLFVAETSLVAREDPPCRLVFTNEGDVPVEVPNLNVNPTAPEFVIEDLNGGDVRTFDPHAMWRDTGTKPLAVNPGDGAWTTVRPGEQIAAEFSLSHRVRLPLPGGYGLSAWFRMGGEVVRSNTVKILVAPAESVRSCLVAAHDGTSAFWFESWVARGAPPLLFVRAARVGARFRQLQCLRVADLPAPVGPVISVAPSRGSSNDRSVAWLHGGVFYVMDVGLERIVGAERSVSLPTGGGFIVEPSWKDPDTGSMRALVWDAVGRERSTLSLVEAQRDSAAVLSTVQVPLQPPGWIRAFHDSSGRRLALFVTDDGARSSLYGLACGEDIDFSGRPFEVWPFRLRGASAQLAPDDTIFGAVVGAPVPGSSDPSTVVCPWSLDASSGRFSSGPARPWPTLDAEPFDHLQLLVDVAGRPAALVHSTGSGWLCLREEESFQVAPPLGLATSLPPTFALGPDGMTPIVVWHDTWRGLIPSPVGVEVPDFLGADFVQPPLAPGAP